MHRWYLAPLMTALLLVAAGCTKQADCKGTAQVCNGSCVELKSDNLNCGACGTVCSAGQVCSNGACTVTCAAGLVNCGGHCIDPASDRTHCGASGACTGGTAGAACGDGQLCSAGQCVQTCSDAQAACPTASPTYCADLARDANNCGACGASCAAGQQCVTSGGTTSCACPAATPNACGTGASAFCTNTANDANNCGSCGTVCGAGTVCSGGQCVQSCSAAEATACPAVSPTYCANTANDANNCGGCGTVCAAGQQCSAGQCACPAATPNACTTGGGLAFCANVATDSLNCGTCGHACGAGEVCVSGTCTLSCAGGATKCAGACVDTKVDTANCGACGNVCPAGQVCSNSTCALTCAGGSTKCGTACVDTRNDVANCGACGTVCSAGQVCSNGACALSCAGGSINCGTTCVDTKNDPANCGGCNVACGAGQVCSNGSCGTVCPVGEYACSGKCIDPMSDPNYCGANPGCAGGQVCGSAEACHGGRCEPTCSWVQTKNYSLASLPAGAQVKGSGSGTTSFMPIYGRQAFFTTSDWSWLWLPLDLSGETTFAVEADVYVPSATTYRRTADLAVFTDFVPDAWQIAKGVQAVVSVDPTAGSFSDWWNFIPAIGWVGTGQEPSAIRLPLVGTIAGGWRTMRVEGDRAAGRYRVLLDGAEVHRWAGASDMTGSGVALGSWYQTFDGAFQPTEVAWSGARVFKGTAACVEPPPRSCAEMLLQNPNAPSGAYVIDADGPGGADAFVAYCDMTTAGGGWTLALAYDHPAGGTAPTVSGIVPLDPFHGYSHMSPAQLAALPFSAMRFFCQTSLHPRKIHAIFESAGSVGYIKGLTSTQVSDWTTFTAMPDHTGNLPAATANVDLTIPLSSRIAFEPFFKQFNYHWNIAATPTLQRFECDDYANGPANATLHQVWVR